MGRVLSKRFLRDLKANAGRYTALVLLIVLGVYLVFSIVGSAETIIRGTHKHRSVNKVEDGSFTVLLPLSDEDISELSENGTIIEKMFYTDIDCENGLMLRMFRVRQEIDLITLDSGRLPEKSGEAVIDKNYAKVHDFSVGDIFDAAGTKLTITGLGTVPDYDTKVASFSDTAVDHENFGLFFVTDEQYSDISKKTDKAEEYNYAYRLGNEDDAQLKDRIRSLDLDYEKVENEYFRETIDEILDKRRKIEDGVNELNDGANELSDGLAELDEAGGELNDAADELLESYLHQAGQSLGQEITVENYSDILTALAKKSPQAAALAENIGAIVQFRDGIHEYTDGASEAADGSAELAEGTDELKEKTDELLDEVFDIDIDNLTGFIERDNNTRIEGAAGDRVVDRNAGLAAGVIVLILFSYVISVFVVHQIEKEQSVIGALYALGVKKRDLLLHYITMPALIAFIGGLIGFGLGISPIGIDKQLISTYEYFSLPKFCIDVPAYLIVYALVLPPVISALVNTIVINKKLSATALSLMKNEQSAGSYKQFEVKSKNFERVFSIRQLVRESRSAIAMILGMFISVMVVIMGINCYFLCKNVSKYNSEDTKYGYMYLYKYPDKEVPEGGEGAFVHTLSIDSFGYNLDVSVIGRDGESRFFSAKPEKSMDKVVINNSLNERFGYKKGDIITLKDSAAGRTYSFTVSDVCEYAPVFTVFMNIDSMRELFGEDEDYFNAVYSAEALDIDEGRLYSVTSKEDIEVSSAVFSDMMFSLIFTLIAAGTVILCIVMYLMMGVMIDRSTFGISLIKIFGYRNSEIRRLYLNGDTAVVAVGGIIVIPLAKLIMDKIYVLFVANVACCIKLDFPWFVYLGIYVLLLLICIGASAILVRKINKITPAEVLKNRE